MKAILNATASAMLCAYLAVLPASAQQFTMKLSSPTVNDLTQEWMKEFKAGVEARAGGRIKVEMYPANQLGTDSRDGRRDGARHDRGRRAG